MQNQNVTNTTMKCMNESIYLSADTKSIVHTHTLYTTQVDQTRQKRNEELFTTALEQAESQGYRHFLIRTICNGVRDRTTGLQTP